MLNEKRIVEECINLFNTKGIKTSMDELASSLKMSKRTIYERFSSKLELIQFVLDYYTNYLDNLYKEIVYDNSLSDYDKLEAILNIIPQELCFTETQRQSLKLHYPSIYSEYIKRNDLRWHKTMLIVDKLISNDYSKTINKELIRLSYMSSIEDIAYKSKTKEEFNEYRKGLAKLIIKAIQAASPIVTGGVKLLDLLGKFNIGVLIFSYVDSITPIYMSHGYYSLFNEEQSINTDIVSKVHEEDRNQFVEALKLGVKNNENIQMEYRYKTSKGYLWHKTRCIPIEYDGYKNVFLAVVSDTTESHNHENELHLEKERLALAFEQTNISIWEYDIKLKKLVLSDTLAKVYGYQHTVISDAPRSVISLGKIHKNSVKVYEDFYKDLSNGKETGTCIIQHKNYEDQFSWIKLSYRTIFEYNKPVKAIGIIEKQDNVVDVISKFEQEKSIAKLLEKELLVTLQYNVSKNKVSNLYVNKDLEYNFIDENYTYQEFFDAVLNHIANKEDYQQFNTLFNENKLNEYFEISKSSKHLNYRSIDSNGNIKWYSFTVNFLYEPFTGDRYIFGYIRDIDHKMKLELELDRKVEYDLITRVYIEQVMKNITNYALSKNNNGSNKCCFVLLEIANFNQLKRLYGLDGAEKILFHIGRILRICFNNKYIVGRIPEKQFGIFIPNVLDKELIKELIEDTIITAINSYSLTTENFVKPTINVSIYVAPVLRSTFERLYNNCLTQLNLMNKNDDIINLIDNFDEINDEDNIHELYDSNASSNEYGNIVNSIIKNIMFIEDSNKVVNYILKSLNDYYGAFKTSIFQERKGKYKLVYEHTVGDITDFDDFEIDLMQFPTLTLINKYQKAALVNNVETIKDTHPKEYALMKKFNIYSILLLPLIENNTINGYITISNQTKNINNKDLATTLSYFLSKEIAKKKVEDEEKYLENYDVITNLQNYRMFRKRIEYLKKEAITSLGVVCIKINNYKELTYDYGDTFINGLIKKLSTILKKNFILDNLFRYDNDSFYIISSDSDYQEFKKKVSKIIKDISKLRNGFASIGFTWSDVDLNVDMLLKHSEELMKLNRINEDDEKDNLLDEKLEGLNDALNLNWFEVYLQPKFRAIDGSIYGAEALLRINHPEYGIISPAKFIPLLEKEKLIGMIDLYVFENICKLLNKWRSEKRKLLPISVNYSRVTVLENGILRKTLGLLKKYKIDPSLIIIEITESVGNLEKQTLLNISKSFISNGLRLSLDDFGAEYSNLNTLATIPFYAVKLDKSLINDIVTNERNKVLVENVILTCKKLNMITVVEGVETELQYHEVKKYDCDLVQGYYFEKPIKFLDFEEKYNKK